MNDNLQTEQMANLMPNYKLVKVDPPADWESYHAIRRQVLFEARGLSNYDPNGPMSVNRKTCPCC